MRAGQGVQKQAVDQKVKESVNSSESYCWDGLIDSLAVQCRLGSWGKQMSKWACRNKVGRTRSYCRSGRSGSNVQK